MSCQLREAQRELASQLRSERITQKKKAFDENKLDELDEARRRNDSMSDLQSSEQKEQQQKQEEEFNLRAMDLSATISKRAEQMVAIEHDMHEVKNLFLEMREYTEEQQLDVDILEGSLEATNQRVKVAQKHIVKAAEYQKESRCSLM